MHDLHGSINPTCWPNVNLVFEPSGKLSMLSAADGTARVLLTLLFLCAQSGLVAPITTVKYSPPESSLKSLRAM